MITVSAARRSFQSLPSRILLFLTIALMPLGLISVYQTSGVVREAVALAERDILARTLEAASTEYSAIRRAVGASYALGAMAEAVGPTSPACQQTMARFVDDQSQFIFAGYIQANGRMACASIGDAMDFAEFEDWQDLIRDPRPMVAVNPVGAISGRAVMIVSAPTFGPDGAFAGTTSISIPHDLADTLRSGGIDRVDVALANAAGEIISTSAGPSGAARFEALGLVPRDMTVPLSGAAAIVETAAGTQASVAIVPLVETNIFVIGTWAARAAPLSVSLLGFAAPVFPILMWLASLFVAYFAVDRLVLRHLAGLRGRKASFSGQDRGQGSVRIPAAPMEIQEIARSYNALVERVVDGHGALEASVAEKEVLLKEVHHRVKNNLQLISSILNMQLRTIKEGDAARILRRVQDRVMSLATIHKALYTDTQVDRVRADLLLREIIAGVMNVGGSHAIKTDIAFEPVALDPDQAVPLCLLVTEAVTNALKYAGAAVGDQISLSVALRETDTGQVTVLVRNSRGPVPGQDGAEGEDGSGLGMRLISAFVSQLGGEMDVTADAATYGLRVTFTKLPLRATDA